MSMSTFDTAKSAIRVAEALLNDRVSQERAAEFCGEAVDRFRFVAKAFRNEGENALADRYSGMADMIEQVFSSCESAVLMREWWGENAVARFEAEAAIVEGLALALAFKVSE